MTEHINDADVADYIDNPKEHPRRAEIEAHMTECSGCRTVIETAQAFDEEMDNTLVHDYVVVATRRATEVPPGLLATVEEIEQEEAHAAEYLALVVMSPAGLERAAIADNRAMQTAGMVRLLCEVSRKLREKDPKHALRLADVAIAVAARLRAERYAEDMRREMRGAAWFERANVLRYLGNFSEALLALDHSEAEYRHAALPDHPLATIKYTRSVIYMKSERLDEAARLAGESARVFRMYGDDNRVVHAQLVIGGCLFYRREYVLARQLFQRLLPLLATINEPATEARCLSNLAVSERELGEHMAALLHFSKAGEIYERLDMRTEVLRARWGAGVLTLRMGNILDGVARLRKVAGDMLEMGLANDHALVMLSAVGALFALGELGELPAICANLVRVFTEAPMPENAREALAYLEAAVRAGAVTEPLIESVQTYIEREEYASPFIPPS
jgi:tetratricopeptide (TPR) repeat protein